MRIVGLTGAFGSGKSFVASLFKKLGAKVVDADKIGHKALKRGSVAYKKIVAAFGKKILYADLSIDRKALAGIVFADKKKLEKLNRITHPCIIKEISGKIKKGRKGGFMVVDAPLICEANITGLMDALIVVKASKKNQVERASKKSGMRERDVCRRIAMQMPLKKKIRYADYVVDNNGTKEATKEQVRKIWRQLKKGA
ncbi:MAG: dephospho-CoA kinase [Candidatus Omnitrophica bacterium]|nr:dephospho-CoA kinase [Candidatus Omnitrophota bacterium]